MRFSYFYFMTNTPTVCRRAHPQQVAHWRKFGLHEYLGDPSADRSED
jgi:hypothetical protein